MKRRDLIGGMVAWGGWADGRIGGSFKRARHPDPDGAKGQGPEHLTAVEFAHSSCLRIASTAKAAARAVSAM